MVDIDDQVDNIVTALLALSDDMKTGHGGPSQWIETEIKSMVVTLGRFKQSIP